MSPELWTPHGSRQVQADADVFGALADATGHQDYHALAKTALAKGKQGAVDTSDVVAEMRANRRITKNAGTGYSGGVGTGGVGQFSFATARPRDPLFYWRQNNLPYDVAKDEELEKIRAFCAEKSEQVLMADFTFKPIGEVKGGEEVIGWEYYQTDGGYWKTRLCPSTVIGTHRREAEMVSMTLDSGRVIRCTPDHKWANYAYSKTVEGQGTPHQTIEERLTQQTMRLDAVERFESGSKPAQLADELGLSRSTVKTWYQRWKRGEDLATTRPWANRQSYLEWVNPGVGVHVRQVADPELPVLTPEQREAAGYLGGMIDGEGWVDLANGSVGICQSLTENPKICDKISAAFETVGIGYVNRYSTQTYGGVEKTMKKWFIQAPDNQRTRLEIIKAINLLPSVKLGKPEFLDALMTANYGSEQIVTSVEPAGRGTVVSMQTTTGNYVVAGLASSNCRLLYITHPVIASAIDIFSKYPLIGMEMTGKDDELNDFYGDLFFDQLDYEEFLLDVGREYWTVGEAWPLGTFNDTLGVWESDELINPDDVEVIRSPFLKEPRFKMKLPETIRKIILEREPKWEYEALMRVYPELAHFSREESKMDVSGVLLKQLKFKADSFHPRGIPILMRGFRAVIQEEMLNSAQDAIAERLYTPMIVAKLGASATDLGTTQPWVPNQGDLEAFEASLDAALAGDFRVLIHHFALDISQVFGKEAMPDFSPDFDRLTDRQLQVFGLSRTMLNGAGSGETYAADALNRDIVTQLLSTYQRKIQRFWKSRAMVVAEAQEHYDYDERNGVKYPILEEILEVNEETGEERIVEQPKLLIPDLTFKTMSLADESTNQQFMEALRASGVPISMKTRLVNVDIDLDDEVDKVKAEQIELAVAAQETRKETYIALMSAGLPIPDDLKRDFQPIAQTQGPTDAEGKPEGPQVLPSLGLDEPAPTDALVPTDDDIAAAQEDEDDSEDDPNSFGGDDLSSKMPPGDEDNTDEASGTSIPLPRNAHPSRPPESDEQRGKMPKKDSNLQQGPQHIGARRNRQLDRARPLDAQLDAPIYPVGWAEDTD